MTAIPFAFFRPPGCFTSSDACELLIRYPGGSISHCRNGAGAPYETFLALAPADSCSAVLIWKDAEGTYYRGGFATLDVAAMGKSLAEVMPAPDGETGHQVGVAGQRRRPAAAQPGQSPAFLGLGVPAVA